MSGTHDFKFISNTEMDVANQFGSALCVYTVHLCAGVPRSPPHTVSLSLL